MLISNFATVKKQQNDDKFVSSLDSTTNQLSQSKLHWRYQSITHSSTVSGYEYNLIIFSISSTSSLLMKTGHHTIRNADKPPKINQRV